VKIGVLADIHGNLAALNAVLLEIEEVEEIWCLGDMVGYGPNPNECCKIIKDRAKHCVLGNHDAGVLGKIDLSLFNVFAAEAIKITQKILEKKNKDFLENLVKIKELGEVILVHGSVKNPLTEYIFETHQAEISLTNFTQKFCFVGHTHYPVVFEKEKDFVSEIVPHFEREIKLKKDCRYIINPGAVGQPRDGDWRASFGLFDDQDLTFEFRRVTYPLEKTQARMKKLGLPEFLIQRLSLGR